jgi:hypothetical protein
VLGAGWLVRCCTGARKSSTGYVAGIRRDRPVDVRYCRAVSRHTATLATMTPGRRTLAAKLCGSPRTDLAQIGRLCARTALPCGRDWVPGDDFHHPSDRASRREGLGSGGVDDVTRTSFRRQGAGWGAGVRNAGAARNGQFARRAGDCEKNDNRAPRARVAVTRAGTCVSPSFGACPSPQDMTRR